jgi:uncharacterized protein YdeI (YjbR/CyaY-like superfamily)
MASTPTSRPPRYFRSPSTFRDWLERHHATAGELLVGFHKRHTTRPSLTWPQSVDEALCFGWIDGVRRRVDDERYTIRFTPRRAGSTWSAVNLKRIRALIEEGRMRPAGLNAFQTRDRKKAGLYSYEQRRHIKLPPRFVKLVRAKAKAWLYFRAQAPWYQRTVAFWIVSPKQEETRLKRLARLIACSARGESIDPLVRAKKRRVAG